MWRSAAKDNLRPQRKGYFGAQSHTPRNRCVRFVFGIAAASRNTRFQAACWALPASALHRPIAPPSLAPPLCPPYHCNPVNFTAGTGARCKQQERNRLPVKGEIYRRAFVIYLNGLTKSESPRPPNRQITGATTGVLSASTKRKRSGRQGAPWLAQSCAPPAA